MQIINVFIGIILIFFSTKIGRKFGEKYKNNYYFYVSCKMFCEDLKREFIFKKEYLQKFSNCNYPSEDFNYLLNLKITKNVYVFPDYLTNEDILELTSFLSLIGKSNSKSQIELVDNYKEVFLNKSLEKNETYKKYYKLSSKLGFVIGLALMVMVI